MEIGSTIFEKNGMIRSNVLSVLDHDCICHFGGFLHIESITLDKRIRGQDYFIKMIKACLDNYLNKWTICVLQPYPLESIDNKDFNDGIVKLSLKCARLGFKQLGRNSSELKYWFLRSNTYTGQILPFNSSVDVALKPKPDGN
jgi:hypothetical protein